MQETDLPPPHAGCILEKVSIGVTHGISGSLTFCKGTKEKPFHTPSEQYSTNLIWLSKRWVALWDEQDKRCWLVRGTSAVLHLVRATLENYRNGEFNSRLLFDESKMINSSSLKPNAAIEVLIHPENRKLKISHEKTEITEKKVWKGSMESFIRTTEEKETYRLFEDLVQEKSQALYGLFARHEKAAGENGIKLKMRARNCLEGWDFAELADDYDARPKVATLNSLGWGWVDLLRAIGALPLFGSGFGELIVPRENHCARWRKLPTNQYYLAVSIFDLRKIMKKYGNTRSAPIRPVHSLVWHCPDRLFEDCKCTSPKFWAKAAAQAKHHSPVQVLWPKGARHLPFIRRPDLSFEGAERTWEDSDKGGAVVFGHNLSLPWFWKNDGQNCTLEERDQMSTEIVEETFDISDDNSISSMSLSQIGSGMQSETITDPSSISPPSMQSVDTRDHLAPPLLHTTRKRQHSQTTDNMSDFCPEPAEIRRQRLKSRRRPRSPKYSLSQAGSFEDMDLDYAGPIGRGR